jgi:hypothetical protein
MVLRWLMAQSDTDQASTGRVKCSYDEFLAVTFHELESIMTPFEC